MSAVDPEGRIRHPLDVFHSTFNPDGSNVPAGYVPAADGLGQVEYIDSATFGGSTTLNWDLLTNGDPVNPELVFLDGEVVWIGV